MRLTEQSNGTGGQCLAQCRVIVADGLPLVGAALATLVTTFGYAVTAIAHDTASVHAALAVNDCDMLLVDIDLFDPGLPPKVPVIIASPASNHGGLAAALAHGVAGLIVKTESADLLPLCLARVAAGGQWFDACALADVAVQVEAHKEARTLTPRERDVARLVAAGQRNRTIAAALRISEGTVKMHLHNVYTKLGLESRTQLAVDERSRNQAGNWLSGRFGPPAGGDRRQACEELIA